MTFDKYFAIKFPHRAMVHSTPQRTKLLIAIIFVTSIIYNIPHLFLTGFVKNIDDICSAYVVEIWYSKLYSWLSFTLNCILPFTLLVWMNYGIIKTVRQSGKQFHITDEESGNAQGTCKMLTLRFLYCRKANVGFHGKSAHLLH